MLGYPLLYLFLLYVVIVPRVVNGIRAEYKAQSKQIVESLLDLAATKENCLEGVETVIQGDRIWFVCVGTDKSTLDDYMKKNIELYCSDRKGKTL